MAPGRKRGGKGVKAKSELRLGDLVLAKVKGFPAWPAKISRPEDWDRMPDPRKYFVQFYGTSEIAFVAPADIQPFTIESKNKLLARQGKKVKCFAQAVIEISEEFEELQHKLSNGVIEDESMQTVAPEVHSIDGVVVESMEVNENDGVDNKGPDLKLAVGTTKKSGDAMYSSGSPVPHEPSDEVRRGNSDSSDSMKLSPPGISRPCLDAGSGRKKKRLMKEKSQPEIADDVQNDPEEHDGVISRKRLKAKHGHEKQECAEKQESQIIESSVHAKISKISEIGSEANLINAQSSRKNNLRSPNIFEGKVFKRLTKSKSVGKAEVCRPLRVPISPDDANHSGDKDDFPQKKRHRRSSESRRSALISDKVLSPETQLPIKRRAVCLFDDDEDDESQKTPIHGGITGKVSLVPHVSDSQNKPTYNSENCVDDTLVLVNKGQIDEQMQSGSEPNKVSSPAAQQGVEIRTRESLTARLLSPCNSEKIPLVEVKSVSVSPKWSPQSIVDSRASAKPQSKHSNKAAGGISRKKNQPGDNKSASTSDRSTSFPSKQASSGDKRKSTDVQINGSFPVARTSNGNFTSVHERLNSGKDEKTSIAIDSDSSTSMKNLIAAAQAKKRQAHIQNSYGNPFPFSISEFDLPARVSSPAHVTFEPLKTLQPDLQGAYLTSPFSNVHQLPSINHQENEELEERRVSSGCQATGSSLSGGTEAAVARDAFEGMIETLSRTKESIGRATRLAIDCAKYGLTNEVMELLIQKLENEPSLHRRVDLFFLVDSITQCSHSQKGASYVSTVQAALPRLIAAAAPAGSGAQENRRQCHKVLRLWIERKILPETILRRFLDDIGIVNDDTSIGISQRRPSRSERAIHDPIREMEGMVVDEYGSNTSFQLPGLLSASVFEEEDDFEDILPTNIGREVNDSPPSDHTPATGTDPENPSVTPCDRRHFVLEEVDGELEMEDVSGNQKQEKLLFTNANIGLASLDLNTNVILESASNVSSCDGTPPLPPGSPPETPPLPTSPPPSPPPPPPSSPPPPPPPNPLTHQNPFPQQFVGPPPQPPIGPPPLHVGPPARAGGPPPPPPGGPHLPSVGLPPPSGPPSLPSQQLYPPQPHLLSHHMANFQGNQCNPNAHGSYIDASGRSEVMAKQQPGFPHSGYNSSRPIDYGQGDAYMNPQASQLRQQFAQRPPPGHFPYPNSMQQHQYPPYSVPNFSDGPRRYETDEQWRMQGGRSCSGPSYPHEGYFGPPLERPPPTNVNFQPHPVPNTMPPATQIPVHGVPMMPGNWRPA